MINFYGGNNSFFLSSVPRERVPNGMYALAFKYKEVMHVM
jgi:hypothetical protein